MPDPGCRVCAKMFPIIIVFTVAGTLLVCGVLTYAVYFYIRRLNNSELANAQTLWLGIKTEHKLKNQEAVVQLSSQLKKQ